MKPITLPLEASIVRCLAHGEWPGQWCERRADCAAHETIAHDPANLVTRVAYRKCSTDLFAAFLPLAGFPDDEDAALTYTVKVWKPAQPGATTPAGGGANITGSQASESLVEGGSLQADPSAEGLAVVEQLPQDELLAVAGSDEMPPPMYDPREVSFSHKQREDSLREQIAFLMGELETAELRIASLEANLSLPLEDADMINHPPHYQGKVECIDAIESALGKDGFVAYCRGSAMKYTFRAGRKGDWREDMAKAEWYLSKAREVKG